MRFCLERSQVLHNILVIQVLHEKMRPKGLRNNLPEQITVNFHSQENALSQVVVLLERAETVFYEHCVQRQC